MNGTKACFKTIRGQNGLRAALTRFRDAEEGSLAYMTLVMLILMIMMGGLAVDLMRYEQTRTTLQNTLDRATLASASLTQTLNPTAVVNDYFSKSGMSQYLDGVTVTEGMNFRNVVADASAQSDPYFMQMINESTLTVQGHSMAEQRINNVEVTLVLDVSGSMNDNNKLVNLKSAAKEFVNTVLSNDAEKRISVTIVPFNGQVNLGADLRAKYTNLSNDPGTTNMYCVDLPSSVYSSTGIPTNTPMSMTADADTWTIALNYYDYHYDYQSPTDTTWAKPYYSGGHYINKWCPPEAGNMVTLPSRSISSLQTKIDQLYAVGATSINAGMKWGLAMMDPSLRTTYSQFISAGKIPSELAGRPFDFTDHEALKVVVLMTDGENFAQERLQEAFKSGNSDIYQSTYDGKYSIRFQTGRPGIAGSNQYYVPHKNAWQSTAYVKDGYTGSTYKANRLPWTTVWDNMRVNYVAWQFYARALSGGSYSAMPGIFANQMDTFRTQADVSGMNSQLQSICTLAKNNGVVVYGIAFEAPSNGQTQISGCATSQAHYFNAAGLQIKTAFRAIASNISQLRLTQ